MADQNPPQIVELSVQVIGPGSDPGSGPGQIDPPAGPPPAGRSDHASRAWIPPLMVVLLLAGFAAGYLAAHRTEVSEDVGDAPPRTTLPPPAASPAPTASPVVSAVALSPIPSVPPTALIDQLTVSPAVDAMTIDGAGRIWTTGPGGVVRREPDGTSSLYGAGLFGYDELTLHPVATPDGIWVVAGTDLYFTTDGDGWTRYRSPVDDAYPVDVATDQDGPAILYRSGSEADLLVVSTPGAGESLAATLIELPWAADGVHQALHGGFWLTGAGGLWHLDSSMAIIPVEVPEAQFWAPLDLEETDCGNLWASNGTTTYRLRAGGWEDPVPLPADRFFDPWEVGWLLAAGPECTMWAAGGVTPGGGTVTLARLEDGVWRKQSTVEAGGIASLEVSGDGIVWMGTTAGLVRYDPATGEASTRLIAPGPLPAPAWPEEDGEGVVLPTGDTATTATAQGDDGPAWAGDDRGVVWRFDGLAWTPVFEAGGPVRALAESVLGGAWVASGDLWLVGAGPPRLVAPGLAADRLAPEPDGSVYVLTGGGLYHVEYPG